MKIEEIRIKNYRLFKDIHVKNVPSYMVIVGANGTGKTTFFDIIGFLKDCLNTNVKIALQQRGGFNEVISRECGEDTILIEMKFRMPIIGIERLVTYHLEIGMKERLPVVRREILRYKRGRHGSPFHFLDFKEGAGYAITNEEDFYKPDEELDRESQVLDSPTILAIKGLGQFEKFKAAKELRQLLEKWFVSNFHISDARGEKDFAYADHLSVSGNNLPLYAFRMYEEYREVFDRVLEVLKRRIPGIQEVVAEKMINDQIILKFRFDNFAAPFIDRYVSDGTIKMFAYLLLLNDPSPLPLLCVEEPENQLYPRLMNELSEEFEQYSEGRQVFVSTHSPDFLNAVPLESIFWIKKEGGYSIVQRALDDENLKSLFDEGDKPGYLWKQGLFEGADPV